MTCPQCRQENSPGDKFCSECGARLPVACPACGASVAETAKFCSSCGQALQGSGGAAGSRSRIEMPSVERRQLTVMFCDLVAFTPLSQRLDPEELREVVRAHQEACSEVIRHFDGHVAQLLGDGLLVYFGWPQAHEDDAQRAVRAGLRLLDATAALSGRLPHVGPDTRLAVRVGIHTGLVMVGAMGGAGHEERLALGDTPNIASRIQGLAAPDTVVISAATHR